MFHQTESETTKTTTLGASETTTSPDQGQSTETGYTGKNNHLQTNKSKWKHVGDSAATTVPPQDETSEQYSTGKYYGLHKYHRYKIWSC